MLGVRFPAPLLTSDLLATSFSCLLRWPSSSCGLPALLTTLPDRCLDRSPSCGLLLDSSPNLRPLHPAVGPAPSSLLVNHLTCTRGYPVHARICQTLAAWPSPSLRAILLPLLNVPMAR
ncbi:hypothetical protein O6H91_04G013700 [Diphasiastrum complanatum]|uniref:Uncharacterized protein n=1 Tax=Diphasiastrum complanatum TaxID=34168 RepID=A0ACC2DUB4_DIPCM|nr:hypothetical protein O6H91_04G013700 [Diphasiastrum complanatum]